MAPKKKLTLATRQRREIERLKAWVERLRTGALVNGVVDAAEDLMAALDVDASFPGRALDIAEARRVLVAEIEKWRQEP